MFKKKPTVKPLAPLRSSDRRKTADSIIAEYGLQPKAQDDTKVEDKAAATADTTALRNALLPDGVQTARFTTTHGPDLKQVSGTVYVGAYPGDDARVLWFKIEDRMYPTVYTLWKQPGIVPLLHTPGFVVQKLQGGADLMTPGLANGPPFNSRAIKGAVVAIASLEQPSVPVAVGACLIDVSALGAVQGSRGHAVQTMHWAGDEIWAYSNSNKPGLATPESLDGWLANKDDEETLAEQAADLNMDEEEEEQGGVDLGTDKPSSDRSDPTEGLGEDTPTSNGLVEEVDIKELTTKEIDDAFRKAFLYGAYHYKETNSNQPNFGLEYPLTQSFVMSNLVQPFLPAHTPAQANSLQIKKSSYKNIKKFIKSLDKAKIVRTKERDQHETIILDIDFSDAAIVGFKPYRLPKKEAAAGTSQGRGGKATAEVDTGDESIGQKLDKQQYYKLKDRLLPLFASAEASSQSLFTAAEIKPIITAYIESENLANQRNKRLITLNPTLANAVFDGSTPLDKEVLAKGSVPRDALTERILQACTPHYAIVRNSSPSTKPKSGAAPKIKVTLETRSGNKTVTKVSGVEAYFIPPQPLADELRKMCAGSSSVEQLHGSSPKAPVMEIMIQGPQKDAVMKALEKRGVRPAWVEFLDKTKGKKK
ncbi:hypothetical protein AUEXF2481DRAFT_26481 [Aureobasidium subglaciale EXF-2481]|uniref:SUI1 domain-containing protein n=1 Tax=Aureobasidium subglaciale (strain EXF-2481) TaxID=1043005 RepID=A0A074YSZ4_AURSE|nr:uncharacterized protein AUEXF2481DRAFT_26481 [Aureobasidium subglaciale EXF-2481]KAI5207697.1 hypothetical protein E4T38_03323 [Aureobasidium subglaciale]KAI5226520.1 hypothetical protein E4T40_03097 [Aureobasidium subglaciale]KAI5229884.1 hypothetical protein E4T41_03320 [Aureobasidium subglaciale]KAI5264342.1 hypothetical protein E4T46_03098 [Aureobasidium subglaciale]KEQ99264.1 hypothetical protein AUEXF2481DRAFT_26481 [Aureobasidium subglaciale EXF-2481]